MFYALAVIISMTLFVAFGIYVTENPLFVMLFILLPSLLDHLPYGLILQQDEEAAADEDKPMGFLASVE